MTNAADNTAPDTRAPAGSASAGPGADIDKAGLEASQRAYDAASPEERAEFEKDMPYCFREWREDRAAQERNDWLLARGFDVNTTFRLSELGEIAPSVWEQVKAAIEAGHIRPAPQENTATCSATSEHS